MTKETKIVAGRCVRSGMRCLSMAMLALALCAACGDTRGAGADGGLDAGALGGADAGPSKGADAGPARGAAPPPRTGAGPATGEDAGAPDPNELVWRLDGAEVARSSGAEAGSDYLFLPHWGRNVQAYFTSPPAPGTYRCADMGASGVRVSLITMDNSWAGLDDVPARWQTLNIPGCDFSPDTYTVTLTLTETAGRYRGTLHIEVAGAAERAGETLTLDGTFDVAY